MTNTEQLEAGNEGSHEERRTISGMSRNIWCLACTDEFDAEYGTYLEDPACTRPEIGYATIRCGLIATPGLLCDRCNRPLPDLTLAAGVTFSESREHYRPWEEEFFYVEGYATRPAGRRQRADEAGTTTSTGGGNDFGNEVYRDHASDEHVEFLEGDLVGSDERGGASTEEDATSRFIVCPWCHQVAGPENDGDVVRHGLVTVPDTSCTTCHKPLPIGSPATAITFHGDPRHYQPWEHHHLQLVPKPPRRAPLLRPLASCSRLFSRLRLALSQILHTRPS